MLLAQEALEDSARGDWLQINAVAIKKKNPCQGIDTPGKS
jgi:hypothetical protein